MDKIELVVQAMNHSDCKFPNDEDLSVVSGYESSGAIQLSMLD